MNGYTDDLEALLDGVEYEEYEEAAPRARVLRAPSRQSSYVPRGTTTPASQTQVQSAARNLDGKIETLSGAVQALETRTNGLATAQDRHATLLRREATDRRKSTDALRSDVTMAKFLAVLLPSLTQQTVDVTDTESGKTIKVLTPSQNQLATLLPLLLLMPGYGGGGDGKGGFGGGDSMMMLLLVLLLGRNN